MTLLKFAATGLLFAFSLCFSSCGQNTPEESLSVLWPPQVNERYPDLALKNANGDVVQLSSFEGQVLLIEPIGMT